MFETTVSLERNKFRYYAFFICCLASLFYLYDYFIQVAPSVMTHQLMQSFSIGAAKLGALSACFYYS
ncbi:MAG: MFS transporter, partial [Coxiellaceae bacterium]|nr:MFS transporter [Coxiellaceae bacterium]